jgi:hypothetical protein
MSPTTRRAGRLLFGTLLVYALLVASHAGEFWPFSIYPMFSQAGDPWSRTVVRDVTADSSALRWTSYDRQALPGTPFPLARTRGIRSNDLSAFLAGTDTWTPDRIEGLRRFFYPRLSGHDLLIMQANGRMRPRDDSVAVEYVPVVYLSRDTTLFPPSHAAPAPRR